MSGRSGRTPVVAGQFYEADGAALARQIEACFRDPRGPGELPARQRTPPRSLRAAVVPHAGYPFSGPIAARVYAMVATQPPPATVLVLGVDHYGLGNGPALSDRDWETPLGPVAVDHELVRALAHHPIAVDEAAQAREHSIEVQLPFLEYTLPRPRFVALQVPMSSYDHLVKTGLAVREAVTGRDVLVLASSDFSHYVSPSTAERQDRLAIDAILARDPRQLYDTVQEHDISMCGIAPTTVMLAALAEEPLTARLLRWGHSGEVHAMRDVVGYAALVLESPTPGSSSVK
jgi:MEMO1 family protein